MGLRRVVELKFGEIVEYQGVVYRAGARDNHEINVVSNDPADVQKGFHEHAPGVFVKRVLRSEVDASYFVINLGTYQGPEFQITDEREGKFRLFGSSAKPEWGFTLLERGAWEKWVPAQEVERIREERIPI